MNWLMRRWQLKLLAVAMAVGLYLFTATQITVERTLTVRVSEQHIEGLDGSFLVSHLSPREIDITIAGPHAIIEEVNPQAIEPVLRISSEGLIAGSQEFDITERLLLLNPNLTLRSSSVPRIRAEFSRVIEDVLNLEGRPAISGLPEGLRADVSLARSQVLVRGPANVIADLRARGRLAVRPIELTDIPTDITEPMEIRVPLVMQTDEPSIRTIEQPEAVIRISPAPETRVVGPVPVNLLVAPDSLSRYEVVIEPGVIALTVSGPVNRMREVDVASLIRAFVDVVDIERSSSGEDRVVRVVAPSWLTVAPSQVRVSVRPRHDQGLAPMPFVEPNQPEPPPPQNGE
ncbi:MAG: hypothetical protein EA401_06565 [Planctomycetota bacterium]|nr:MAG: hypothetical protein EA401_06565 [Planctomycetota bacterium]